MDLSIDRDEQLERDEPEGRPEEYVKPRLLTLGTLADATGSGPGTAPDGGAGLAIPS